jgi:hypothetical protein
MKDQFVVKILTTAAGIPTDFDNQYIVDYDPTWVEPNGVYDGGVLLVTRDRENARRFSLYEWTKLYYTAHGRRDDGLPNRPITAWHIEVSLI